MTTIAQPHGDPVLGTPSKLRVAIGSAVGTTVENYDFIGYGTAAALYFGTAFFPSTDPVTGTVLSFATLGIGFAARPKVAALTDYQLAGGRPTRTVGAPATTAATFH